MGTNYRYNHFCRLYTVGTCTITPTVEGFPRAMTGTTVTGESGVEIVLAVAPLVKVDQFGGYCNSTYSLG